MIATSLFETNPAVRCGRRGCWLLACEEAAYFGRQLCAEHWLGAAEERMNEIMEIDGDEYPDSPYIAAARKEFDAAIAAAERELVA